MIKKHKNPAKGENTVIGAGTVINGGITSDAMVVRIDGKVDGEILSKGEIIVGTDGIILGNVDAASVVVGGEIKGNVKATVRLELESGAKLTGDVKTPLLAVSETAVLQGSVSMTSNSDSSNEKAENSTENDKENGDK